MEFVIAPYISVGPLNWRMNASAVTQIIGGPSKSMKNRAGNFFEFRNDLMMSCIYDKTSGLLIEVGFSKKSNQVFFSGMDLVEPEAVAVLTFLYEHDSTAVEGLGSQVFPLLGISLTGYSPEEGEIKAVTAFGAGRWDVSMKSMEKLNL